MDETTLSLHPPLRACWMKRGSQKRIPTPGYPQRYHLFGAYNWADDTVTYLSAKRKNSQSFITFVEHLLVNCYPDQPLVVVLDNASYHTSTAALAALSLFEQRVWFFWLPPYCSMLNPIERFWQHLKGLACADKLFPNLPDLIANIERHLLAQNDPHNVKRFSISKLIQ